MSAIISLKELNGPRIPILFWESLRAFSVTAQLRRFLKEAFSFLMFLM